MLFVSCWVRVCEMDPRSTPMNVSVHRLVWFPLTQRAAPMCPYVMWFPLPPGCKGTWSLSCHQGRLSRLRCCVFSNNVGQEFFPYWLLEEGVNKIDWPWDLFWLRWFSGSDAVVLSLTLRICYDLNVCLSKIRMLKVKHKGDGVRRWGFGMWIGHKGCILVWMGLMLL